MAVDSFKWLPRSLAGYYRAMQVAREEPVPWAPLDKPLSRCRVAAVTTAGIHVEGVEPPFDAEREKREPTWGDPTFRTIASDVRQEQIGACHLHIDNGDLLGDLDVCLPVHRLHDLCARGEIGSVAPRHLSFMGFQLDNSEWRERYAPQAADLLRADGVDCILLTPV
jgi:D-proline reductase (dithiol) PrdB